MKKLLLFTLLLAFAVSLFAKEKPKVYFTADISSAGVQKVYEMIKGDVTGKKIAIKVHFGEEGNQNFLKPELIKDLAVKLNATLVETNVLYVSKRRYTESHIQLAIEHGFDFCPIDILDSEGETVIPIEGGKHYKEVKAGSHLDNYDSYIIFSHFKGHGMLGVWRSDQKCGHGTGLGSRKNGAALIIISNCCQGKMYQMRSM